MSSTKIKPPTQSNNKTFVYIVIGVVLAVVGGLLAWKLLTPSESEKAAQEALGENVSMNVELNDGVVKLSPKEADRDAVVVDIYEDFSCKYCAQLAIASDDDLKKVVEEGKAIVNIHTLNFLDRGEVGHSTKTLAATHAAASEGDANQYWNLRSYMLEHIADVYGEWDSGLKDTLVSGGLSENILDKSSDDTALKEAESSASSNAKSLEERIGQVSSPHVFIDGREIILDPDTGFETWVQDEILK